MLTAQLGEMRARKVYAAVLEAALHLREALVSGKALGPLVTPRIFSSVELWADRCGFIIDR